MAKQVEKPQPQQPQQSHKSSPAPDYSVVVGLRTSEIPEIADRLAEIEVAKKALIEEEKELKARGATLLIKAKVKSVMVGELRVTQTGGASTSIKKILLLKFGVSEKVIAKATVKTPWTSLKVTDTNKADEEGEEDGAA